MKSASGAMASHIVGEVTTLATLWKVKRQDGVALHFTSHDQDLTVDIGDGDGSATYEAETSFNRSAIASDDSLAVANLDITGVLSSDRIAETDLRRGLYNFAEVKIAMVNWDDLTQGIIKMRSGWLGEVTVTPNGYFVCELRGLAQAFARNIGELFSPDCRADLGDSRCKLPVDPERVVRGKAYAVGSFVKAAPEYEGVKPSFFSPFDTSVSNLANGASATLGVGAILNTGTKKYGAASIEFSGATGNPSVSFVSYPDSADYTLGNADFCIEGWVRFKSLATTVQTIASHWNATGNQRSWALNRNGANLDFAYSLTGATTAATVSKAATWLVDTWYHVAVIRTGGKVYLFQDGVALGDDAGTIATSTLHDCSDPLRLGKTLVSGGDTIFNGFIDDFCITRNWKKYAVAGFTPPTAIDVLQYDYATLDLSVPYADFGGTIWRCSTAGTTAAFLQPHYSSSPVTDGTAVFTSEVSWSKVVTVTDVDPAAMRKGFTVTELAPFSGGTTAGRDYFPDDCMNNGLLLWTDGPNAGKAMEVRAFTGGDDSQVLELFLAMPFDITVGDVARLYRGCQKRRDEDCVAVFNNAINFRGEPDLPGIDLLTSYPSARSI